MLDLGFVRGNLEFVEEKLRARGADPAVLLGDFRALDQSRRQAITTAEQLKARRNELSQQVGALKKAGPNEAATVLMEETRALKEKLDELDKAAVSLDEQLRLSLARVPNLTRDEVPKGPSEADNVNEKTWGEQKSYDFGRGRTGNWAKRSASSTWNARPSSAARGSPSIWAQARGWSAR